MYHVSILFDARRHGTAVTTAVTAAMNSLNS